MARDIRKLVRNFKLNQYTRYEEAIKNRRRQCNIAHTFENKPKLRLRANSRPDDLTLKEKTR